MKNNVALKIDKGIPIPSFNTSHIQDALKKMEIGDSVFIQAKRTSISGSLQFFCKGSSYRDKFKTRTEKDGVRVWRIG